MLKRVIFITCVMFMLIVAVQSCTPPIEFYTSMRVQDVGGAPYLVLGSQHASTDDNDFGIFKPKDKNPAEWEPVAAELLGVPYGTFSCKTGKNDCLGVFYKGNTSLFDLSQKSVKTTPRKLPFDKWIAETTSELNGVTYAFGAAVPEDPAVQNPEGPLKVAKWNGENWEELGFVGPIVSARFFSLEAVNVGSNIKVFWRKASDDRPTGLEGPQASTEGPMEMATFDDKGFAPTTVAVRNLPRGNTSLWADGQNVKVLIQTRSKAEDAVFVNAPMEIWTVEPDGKPELSERIETSQSKTGLLSFIAAEHFACDGREYILRSNWQMFQVWQRAPGENGNAGAWTMISPAPKGLPTYDLQSILVESVTVAVVLIAFGVVLAYRRRKHAWTLMRRIQVHEIYADIGLRVGAYVVDVSLVLLTAWGLGHYGVVHNIFPGHLFAAELNDLMSVPLLVLYVLYFCGAEWLTGATIGKFMMGLRVVMDGGRPLSLWAAIVRNLVGYIERLPFLVPFVAMTMILISPRRQRLGDILSRSFVVHKGALEAFKAQREQDIAKQNAEAAAEAAKNRPNPPPAPAASAAPAAASAPVTPVAPAVPVAPAAPAVPVPPAATTPPASLSIPESETKDKGPQQ